MTHVTAVSHNAQQQQEHDNAFIDKNHHRITPHVYLMSNRTRANGSMEACCAMVLKNMVEEFWSKLAEFAFIGLFLHDMA